MCKSEIEQKNKSPNKSPVKQAIKNEDIIKNINLDSKEKIKEIQYWFSHN